MPLEIDGNGLEPQANRGMIYIIDKALLSVISTAQLLQAFSLTRREAHVCQGLLAGKVPKSIAADYDLSIYTVREHLRNVYQKTGTKNQIELVNLLASLPVSN